MTRLLNAVKELLSKNWLKTVFICLFAYINPFSLAPRVEMPEERHIRVDYADDDKKLKVNLHIRRGNTRE